MAKLITAPSVGTTVTFTTSQTWTCPAGVVTLLTVVGKGQDGTAAVAGGYGASTHHTATVALVQGVNEPLGGTPRFWSWGSSQSDISAIRDQINIGGSGSYTSYSITQYTDNYTKTTVTTPWTNSIPGSATTSTSAGWRTSGAVSAEALDFGYLTAVWDELGTYSGGTAATTGSNTTGFSKTWNGGVGVPATSTTYTNITVVPATGYPVVVPTGGYISITY